MNEVKNVLPLLLRQEAIHGDQIGLLALQRRAVADQTRRLLMVEEVVARFCGGRFNFE